MSNRGFQEALAHLLVRQDFRRELIESPARITARFELTPLELRRLGAIGAGQLEFTAQGIVRLRARTLKRVFATTFRLSGNSPQLHDALSNFLATDLPEAGVDEASRWLAEGRRFVTYLARDCADALAPHIAELARLEWLRFDLLYSPEADRSARRADAHQLDPDALPDEELHDRLRLELGRHVRLAEFSFDVLAIKPGQALPGTASAPASDAPVTTYVALSKHPARASVGTYRISAQACTVFRACDGTRSLREICMTPNATPEMLPALLSSAAELGRFGLTHRLLLDSRPAATTRLNDVSGVGRSGRSDVADPLYSAKGGDSLAGHRVGCGPFRGRRSG